MEPEKASTHPITAQSGRPPLPAPRAASPRHSLYTVFVYMACILLWYCSFGDFSFFARQPRQVNANASPFSGMSMRILPLGASITYGSHSTDGNGYRLDLLNMLMPPANVTYIGTQQSGNMTNNQNEGHPGFVISQMEGVAAPDLALRPNIILIYVGTNDMLYPVDPANAPARMASLVQYLYAGCPDALILVPTLFMETNPACQANINTFNAALPGVVAGLQGQGIHAMIADFQNQLTVGDLYTDGEHPNDMGYQIMANVWYSTLVQAAAKGWINSPVAPNTTVAASSTTTTVTTAASTTVSAASLFVSTTTTTSTHSTTSPTTSTPTTTSTTLHTSTSSTTTPHTSTSTHPTTTTSTHSTTKTTTTTSTSTHHTTTSTSTSKHHTSTKKPRTNKARATVKPHVVKFEHLVEAIF